MGTIGADPASSMVDVCIHIRNARRQVRERQKRPDTQYAHDAKLHSPPSCSSIHTVIISSSHPITIPPCPSPLPPAFLPTSLFPLSDSIGAHGHAKRRLCQHQNRHNHTIQTQHLGKDEDEHHADVQPRLLCAGTDYHDPWNVSPPTPFLPPTKATGYSQQEGIRIKKNGR